MRRAQRAGRLGLALFCSAFLAGPSSDALAGALNTGIFPGRDWISAPLSGFFSEEKFRAFEHFLFDPADAGHHTEAALLVKDGLLVYERYAAGFGPDRAHPGWSMSKSVSGAVVGIAVAKHLFDLDAPLAKALPWKDCKADLTRITARHLLNMSSGIAWDENYTNPVSSDVIRMLYSPEGYADMGRFVCRKPQERAPGAHVRYSSGDTNLLMAALKHALGATYADFPWKELFDRTGMRSTVWERDASGTFVGSSFVHASARDFARLGLLYLRGGIWDGARILPESWVAFSRALAPAAQAHDTEEDPYGASWWLNLGKYPSAPREMYQALGHEGQQLFVFPSQNMVFVRLAADDARVDRDKMLALLMESLDRRPRR